MNGFEENITGGGFVAKHNYEVGELNIIIPDQRGQEEGNWNEKRGKK